MAGALQLGELRIDVIRKDIKHTHLSVHPPTGRVRIAAPRHLSEEAIRAFAVGKLGWIRRQQAKIRAQERETPREYVDRESHYVWGRRYLLRVVERDAAPSVDLRGNQLNLTIRPNTDAVRRAAILEAWYRVQLRAAAQRLAARWTKRLGVELNTIHIQHMRTRWGSCNPAAGSIRLNTDLAKKPRACLEYIVVHELVHLLEPTHNARFVELMAHNMPGWEQRREILNRLPVRHVDWRH